MNLKWLKQHSLTVGSVAAFVILLAVLIWLQQKTASKLAKVDAALLEQQSQYDRLKQQKVAPSRENIAAVKRDREQLDHLYGQLLGAVSHNIEVTNDLSSGADFNQLTASVFNQLRKKAKAENVKLPDGFAFGFSRYVGKPPTDAKRILVLLDKQLTAIDHVSQLLMSNHVAEIVQIRRAEVEPGAGAQTGVDALEARIKTDANALYEVLSFEFEFKCSGQALRAFLDSLSKAELFLAVRRLQVTGEMPTTEKASTGTGAAAAAGTPVTSSVSKSSLLTVTVRIDLIEFRPPQPVRKEAGKPRA